MMSWSDKRYVPEQPPRIPLSQMEIFLELSAVVGLLFHGLVILKWWAILPSAVPTHFGPSGLPDAWGSKTSLTMLPVVSVILYITITLLSKFPNLYNYPCRITEQNHIIQYYLARAMLAWIKTEMIWMFAWINYQTIQVALGMGRGLGVVFMPATILVMVGTVGIYLRQAFQSQ